MIRWGAGLVACMVLAVPVIAQTQSPVIPLDPTRTPEQILEQTPPVTSPEPDPPPQVVDDLAQVIVNALTNTAVRYPWLTNPTDRLTFPANSFNPSQAENYIDTELRLSDSNPFLLKLTYGSFPASDQFYWLLPENRVVIETLGNQGGLIHQGRGQDFASISTLTFTRALAGLQNVITLPEVLTQITRGSSAGSFSVFAAVAITANPEGLPAPLITLDTGTDVTRPNVTVLSSDISIGVGSTNSPTGGGSNFGNLQPDNTPQVVQGFPTVNLQPLILPFLENGEVLRVGSVIPPESLAAINLDISSATASDLGGFSSLAGIKILQPMRFDNFDLLQALTNPFLGRGEKLFYYFNSLFWTDFGFRTPETTNTVTATGDDRWYRAYYSRPHRQTIIQYDPQELRATLGDRFSNPGVSVSFSLSGGQINLGQTINQTLGLALGGIFLTVDPDTLQAQVDDAKARRDRQEQFVPLQTAANSQERRQINERLNIGLFYSNLSSSLEQISGSLTLDGEASPTRSSFWQIRTGLHRRVVQFLGFELGPIEQGDTIVTFLRLSDQRFGPLTFIGAQFPRPLTALPLNEAIASEVVITAPDGQQFVQRFNSNADLVTLPIGIDRQEFASDRIELSRTDRQEGKITSFLGNILVPAVEMVASGTSGQLNYSLSSGLWLNVAPRSAGNVAENTDGLNEPSFGAYLSAFAALSSTELERNEAGQVTSVTIQSPVVRAFLTTGTNINNASFLNLSYTFSRQVPDLSFSLSPGLLLASEGERMRMVPFFQGTLDLGAGLRLRSSLEFDQNTAFTLEALQQLSPNWGAGVFYRNFREINVGVDTRTFSALYGLTARYQVPQSAVAIEGQVGFGSTLDLRLRGNLRF
ncbi:MAG: hypothetical protein HC919_02805 [Oscillatoriales cyanobacterium SM2_2_1]|nr:hypothetical protein [Oscillatoriales cyanobacterium SM2_2_1]